ncbi:lipase/esterase [Alphaproteobacteria bacterium]|nr:lipase/esterase [Alphaproteobacteria bacterium]
MATRVLLFMLCLLTSCLEQENGYNTVLESKYTAVPSEKSNIILNDLLAVVSELLKDLTNLTPQRKREASNNFFLAHAGSKDDVKEIKDSIVKAPDNYQIPIRTYAPLKSSNRNFIVMYVHGGGWTQGNLETHDPLCRKIANILGVMVISVDYRLAPEHPFPTPLNDVSCVYSWIVKNYPNAEIVLSGDSAGGNLSAALCIKISREKQKKPYAQILLYAALPSDCESKSFEAYGNMVALPKDGTKFYYKQYAGDEQKTNPLVSPVLQEDVTVFPPTMFIAAECDVLLDGQILLYEKLKTAGIETNMVTPKGTVHGFMSYLKEFDEEAINVLRNETSAFIDKIWAKE